MKTFIRFVQLFFVFVLLINSSIYAQWTAYNDCSGTNSITNTTNILGVSGTGTLKNFDTGATLTGVTATFTSNGSPNLGTSNGAATNSGTDAYNIFNGNANLVGVVNYGSSSGWYIDLTISGLDPTKTYTFVTTANRADASYTARISRYTISDISAANNASSDGVTVISNESVSFCTGYNSVNGYVARWTGIQTGTDGDFTIRADYPSNYQAYGLSVFMLQEEASTGPNINTTGSLNMFHSEPGIPSAEQSYTVSGTNLTAEIILNAPADFEISTNSGSGFSSSLSLSPISGTVVSTPVYVRFNRATEGTSSGDITHTSTDASTRNVAVNGEAIVPPVGWTAYNDCASPLSSESNITSVGFSTTSPYNYTGDAILLDQATGKSTGVTANLVKSGTMQTTTAGDDTPEGTDAYSVFYPFTDMSGVNNGTASGWYMDLTFIGLNPTKKYTFVTSVARQGGTSTYDTRNSMFTISDLEGAANASSVGVTEVNNLSVWFNGGQNSEGRVARWTGIQPGADGDFKVRAEAQGTNVNGYGFSVFMLKEETSSPAINITGSLTPFNIIPGSPSVEQSYSVSGSNLTENIVITAPADFLIKEDGGTYGSNVSLIPVDGTVASTIIYVQFNRATEGTSTGNIEHTSDGATTRNVPVSGTAEEVPNEITISVRVNQSTDDSEEDTDDGSIDIESSDLELIHDSSYNRDQIVGMRFQNVEIPAGANILSAYIEFETDETVNTNPCNLRILGQAADNPATFTENVNDISSRNQTSASVNWSPEDWPTVNVKHQTPDITSIVQEIVNRAGWTSGNAMVYLIEGTGQRVAESWDGEPENAPLLVINYTLSAVPTIILSGIPLNNFSSQPGTPSAEQNYTVSGINLTEDIVITAPTDFEISTSGGSGFGSTLTLVQTGGSVAETPVYVRMNSATVGSLSGNISHNSSGASEKNVAVNGTVTEPGEGWIAYNDGAYMDGQISANITTYPCYTNGQTGLLKKYIDNSNTPVNLQVTTSGTVAEQISGDYLGSETNEGTDAYTTFHGIVDIIGGIRLGTTSSYVDLTFTGLDAAKTYAFATTANRNNSESDYINGVTKFTISDIDGATNASTAGVTVIDNLSVSYSTGYNTVNGFVARWTEIQPGADGDFKIRFEVGNTDATYAYGPAAFLLQEGSGSGPVNQTPNQAVLVQPVNDATGVSTSPTLEVTVSDPDEDQLTVTFYGRAVTTTTAGEDFTIVALPDIQNESQYAPQMITSQMNWIVDQKEARNIVFVTSLGDLVNTASDATQWGNADAGFDLLDAADVSYSVGPGNHDLTLYTGSSLYPTYFGSSRFAGKSYYGGSMTSDNYNNYSLFSASGMDFILINLQYDPTTAMLDWADALLKANPNRRGIYVQHNILNINDTWQSQASYTALKDNPNLFLMLCGHMHSSSDGAAYRSELGDDGHTIHIMLADYQDYSNGNGYLRLLRFSPADDKIYATTYSPYLPGSITTYPDQMEMVYDMAGNSSAFEVISSVGVASGSNASVTWSGLDSDIEYEWYTVVSDGNATSTGSTWSFTTGTAGIFTLTAGDDSNGSVTLTPSGGTYNSGTTVTLLPVPEPGYKFNEWTGPNTGDIINTAGVYTILMNGNKTVSANFSISTILGDVNGDLLVNSTDALIVLTCDAGLNTILYCPMNCGDVNGDGKINSTDALIILSYDAHLTVQFPLGQPGYPLNVTPCSGCNQ